MPQRAPAEPAATLATILPRAKHDAFTARLLEICAGATRTAADLLFVRDRLCERCAFFRAFPPRLQAAACRLARARRWAPNEVVVGAGDRPERVYFVVEGRFGVATRAAGGGSALEDVAALGPGDSFGEAALLGAARAPAFVVARSAGATVAVDAMLLAAAMEGPPPFT